MRAVGFDGFLNPQLAEPARGLEGLASAVPDALQADLLKQAFTALSFGARKTAKAWVDQNGEWARPAMVEIFRVKDERDRFLKDVSVVGFVKEQAMLDDFLFNGVKQHRPDLLKLPYLQTQGGSASKSKCVAFLYQHEETAVMEVVRDAVVAHGKTVLASIHDAIITKEKLGVELMSEIEQLMRDQTGNRYWRLGANQLKRYATPRPLTQHVLSKGHSPNKKPRHSCEQWGLKVF